MDRDIQGFVMYRDFREYCGFLSNEEKGLLLDALFGYAFEGEKPEGLSAICALAFAVMKNQMDRDFEKYEKKCEKNRKNGALGGRPKKEEARREDKAACEAATDEIEDNAGVAATAEMEDEAACEAAEGKRKEKRKGSAGAGRKSPSFERESSRMRDDEYYDDFFSAALECALEGASP